MDDVEAVMGRQPRRGLDHVLVHGADPRQERVEVAARRLGLGHAVHAHAGPDLLRRVALPAAGEDVDDHALRHELLGQLAHVARQAALDDRRVLPGQDEDAPGHGRARA